MSRKPEILAPVGNRKMLTAAVNSGADAVYFGLGKMNMRAKANNFKIEDLKEIVDYCHSNNVDAHLTLNAIIYEDEIDLIDKYLIEAKAASVDMIICWDAAVIEKCKKYELPFCISTQASISNSGSANFYKEMGAKRIVLARECTLKDIKQIKDKVDIEIEAFVHGAMCLAVSGRCLLSHYAFGKSANRGECIQPCRREYEIYDKDDDFSLTVGKGYVLSPNDLCSINFIDELIDAGIDSFKIEGRKRSPEYVAKVVSVYRKAVDLHLDGKLTNGKKVEFENELKMVYNRGFSDGFYFGIPAADKYARKYGSEATSKKVYAGKVINYFKKSKIVHIKLESENITKGDEVYLIGNSTGVTELSVPQMMRDKEFIDFAEKGDEITFYSENISKPGDELYKIILKPQP